MLSATPPRCQASKTDGSPCKGLPISGSIFCWYHDPTVADQRERGRSLGGSARSNEAKARKLLKAGAITAEDAAAKLGPVLDQVIDGTMLPNVANAAATVARAIAAIRETAELERRIEALEQANGITPIRKGA